MNNIFFNNNCPVMDNDKGRLFTNYGHSKYINNNIKKMNNLENDNQFRLFLQNNGENLINIERKLLDNKKCVNDENNKFYLSSENNNINYLL